MIIIIIVKTLSEVVITPVCSVSCERFFSALRRLKLWTRSSMIEAFENITRGLREKLESMRRSGSPIGLCPDFPLNSFLSSTFKKRQFFTLTPDVVLGCKKKYRDFQTFSTIVIY